MNVVQPAAATSRDEVARELVGVVVVDAEPRLDGDGHGDGGAHGTDALRDARGLEHQRGAETAGLDAVAGTADVEIDLVVAGRSAEPRRGRELAGIAAAELQRDGVLGSDRSAAAGRRRRAATRAP